MTSGSINLIKLVYYQTIALPTYVLLPLIPFL